MITVQRFLQSTVGRKYLIAISGLALVGFILTHLAANLLLLLPSSDPFNLYAHKLASLGPGLYILEAGLAAMFVLHIGLTIGAHVRSSASRPEKYAGGLKAKEGPVTSSIFSKAMRPTGMLLLIFLIIHILQFKFGPGIAAGYTTDLHGESARDLYRLVIETFAKPTWVAYYVAMMLFLGMHLRHGFWSAFQSLGVLSRRNRVFVILAAALVAAVFAVGFLGIPVFIFIKQSGGAL